MWLLAAASSAALAVTLASCAARPHVVAAPAHEGDRVADQVEKMRDVQLGALMQFDGVLTSMSADLCPSLCGHHSAICDLATRICAISKNNSAHARAAELCEHATTTCRDASDRLPKDCLCEK
ncbi:MAG: hypothetical protein IV100_05485 [Myxococcales bacterium]|nr:hypothetical protein [Myxococcales bacterium]